MIAWLSGQPLPLKIALGLVGAVLLGFCLWLLWLRKYLECRNVRTLNIQERVGLKIEFIKTAAQIVGGLFFILTILVAYWNYQVSQKNLEATQKKNENDLKLAQEKQVTELYVKAIGQLGSDKLPIILGGLYALERIARGSQKDKGPILEVLTAYVRHNAPWPPEEPAQARKRRPWTKKGLKVASQPKRGKTGTSRGKQGKAEKGEEISPEPDTDIQAVLTIIGRLGPVYDAQGKPQSLDLARTDLRGAGLRAAHLEGANLVYARLEYAYLEEAHLEGASLWEAHLEGAYLWKAHLEGAVLLKVHLERAILMKAHLEGADLRKANLEGAVLNGAHLERARLWLAHLEKVDLRGADLKKASGLTQPQIDAAYCDEKTLLPPFLKRSEKKHPFPW
jgi:hypothetical protein